MNEDKRFEQREDPASEEVEGQKKEHQRNKFYRSSREGKEMPNAECTEGGGGKDGEGPEWKAKGML